MRAMFACLVLIAFLPLPEFINAQDAPKTAKSGLIVVNTDGQEHTLKNWHIVLGTGSVLRNDPIKPPAKGEPAKQADGPEYLEFREDNSTSFEEGILTLVPITSIRQIDYDDAKKTVALTMVQADGKEVVLTGTTKYRSINKLTIEGDIDAKDLEGATVRVQGGMPNAKPAVKSFRFPSAAQPPPKVAGPGVIITAVAKEKLELKANDLKALYRAAGQDRVSANLLFKKQARIDLAKIVKMKHVQVGDKKQVSWDYRRVDERRHAVHFHADPRHVPRR